MSKKFIGLILVAAFLLLPVQGLAAEWFVRPAGQQYGTGDGKSYENAWSGFGKISLGVGGMMPGDTIWVCGLHVHDLRQLNDMANSYRTLGVLSGLSETERTVVRGDYPSDPGVIWGAARLVDAEWTNEGNGVYSTVLFASIYGHDWIFQDIGVGGPESHVVLDFAQTLDECRSTPGSHYSDSYSKSAKLYIHTTDGASPNNRIAINWWGNQISLPDGSQYITFKNLTYYNPWRFVVHNLNAVTWDGCKLIYGWHSLITPTGANQNLRVLNCELAWAANGIYNVSQTDENGWNDAVSNFTYSGNYIHDIGVRATTWNRDAHAIGIQGGQNGLIENNVAVNCGNAIMLYAFTTQDLKNVTVRGNLVKDTHRYGNNTGYGIGTMCNNDSLSDKSGNVFYHNMVVNATVGYRFQFEWDQVCVNNVAVNCGVGLQANRGYYAPDGKIYGSKITARNNIFLNSSQYHVEFNTPIFINGAITYLDSDYNTYYPVSGQMFKIAAVKYTFDAWKGTGRDTHGNITIDPKFVNSSGDFDKPSDFELPSNSELRDKGESINGITQDLFGKAIIDQPEPGVFELPAVETANAETDTTQTTSPPPETTPPTTDTSGGTTETTTSPPTTDTSGGTTETTTAPTTDTSGGTTETTTASTETAPTSSSGTETPYWQTVLGSSYRPTTRTQRATINTKMYDYLGVTSSDWGKLSRTEQRKLLTDWNSYVYQNRLEYFHLTAEEYKALSSQTRLYMMLHYEQQVLAAQ